METSQDIQLTCLNCQEPIGVTDGYCSNCGQKNKRTRIRFRDLIADSFEQVFNIDSSIFRTMRYLYVPGKVALAFCRGERKRYIHPIRLFLLSAILLLASINNASQEAIDEINFSKEAINGLNSKKTRDLYKIRDQVLPATKPHVDTIIMEHLVETGRLSEKLGYNYLDSINLNSEKKDDTITFMVVHPQSFIRDENDKNSRHRFHVRDLIMLPVDTLAKSVTTHGLADRIAVKQYIKFFKHPSGSIRYMLGSILWTFVLLIPAISLFLRIWFFRRKRYYVEHVIFTLYAHSAIFFLIALFMLPVFLFQNNESPLVNIVILLFFPWFVWSLKRFYQIRWINAIFTTFVAGLVYFFAMLLYLVISAILRFLLI